MSKTPGQIAYEAYYTGQGSSPSAAAGHWRKLCKGEQRHWDAVADAVLEEAAKVADDMYDRYATENREAAISASGRSVSASFSSMFSAAAIGRTIRSLKGERA